MLINIFEELSWQQFIKLESFRNLPLNEQKVKYNQYISDLSINRQSWIMSQNKGVISIAETISSTYPSYAGGPYSRLKFAAGYIDSEDNQYTFVTDQLNQTQINSIISLTSTNGSLVDAGYLLPTGISSPQELSTDDSFTSAPSGGGLYYTAVTNRNITQDGTTNLPPQGTLWTSGVLEYIINYEISSGDIVNIVPFLVP